jgi:hypothetical protein
MKKFLLALGIAAMACNPSVKEEVTIQEIADAPSVLEERVIRDSTPVYDNARGEYGYIAVRGELFWARADGRQLLLSTNYGGMKVMMGCEDANGPQPGPYTTIEQISAELRQGRIIEIAVPYHNIAMLGYDQSLDNVCPGAVRFDVDYTPLLTENWREETLRGEREHDQRLLDDPRLD